MCSDSIDAIHAFDGHDAAAPGTLDIGARCATSADRDFLRSVFISTRRAEFARSGLESARIDALLAEQFEIQDAYYRRHYPHGHFEIVTYGVGDIGRLYHDWDSTELRLIDIALLPSFRGRGIGTRLMHALVAEASRRALAASLYVEMDNPVRSLYRRLGFVTAGENGVYEIMRREVAPFQDVVPMPSADANLSERFRKICSQSATHV